MPYCPPGWEPLPPESKIVSCFGGVINGHAGSTAVAKQRALEVKRLLEEGLNQSEIAKQIGCSRVTIREHIYTRERRYGPTAVHVMPKVSGPKSNSVG